MRYKRRVEELFFRTRLGKFGVHLLWGMIFAGVLFFSFAILAKDVFYKETVVFDSVVSSYIHGFTSPMMTKAALFITNLGSAFVMVTLSILGVVLLFRKEHIREGVVLGICFIGGGVLNETLKHIFQRVRPDLWRIIPESGFSFPSGHAMSSAAFYGFLGYLLWLNLRSRYKRAWLIPIFSGLLILLIGSSRIYLGVHYPSDVVAGFAAGGAWMASCIIALQVIHYYRGNKRGDGY